MRLKRRRFINMSLLGRLVGQKPQNTKQTGRRTRIVGSLFDQTAGFVQRQLDNVNQLVVHSASGAGSLSIGHLAIIQLLKCSGCADARSVSHHLLDLVDGHIVAAFLLHLLLGNLDEWLGLVHDASAKLHGDAQRSRKAFCVYVARCRRRIAEDAVINSCTPDRVYNQLSKKPAPQAIHNYLAGTA